MPSVTFVICTERGLLEPMSVVLVRSLRRWGGAFRDAPVLSYQPRPGYEVAPKTLHALQQLGVTHLTEPLNEKYAHYPQGNKPPVCAHAERTTSTEHIVFLDSDMLVLNEPRALLPTSHDIGLRPSDKVGVATSGPTDRNYAYWHQLYQLLDVDPSLVGRVDTTVDQQTIYAYYNSGVMSVRREAGIFRQWNNNYERVMASRLKPKQGIFHTDQTTLAATLAQQQSAVEILPPTYNYPFHLHHNVPIATRIRSLGQAPLLHYHKALHYPAGESALMSLAGDEQQAWLQQQIAYLRTVMPPSPPKQGPLNRLMGRLTAWLR